jgi:thiamine kinase-like enzyme
VAKPLRFKEFVSEETQDEALDMTQRLARSRQFKRNKAKIALGRKRAAQRTANMDTLKKRARKQARNIILKKLTKDIDKSELSLARRRDIEKRLDKKKNVIDKMSRKLIPQVRQQDKDRKRGSK